MIYTISSLSMVSNCPFLHWWFQIGPGVKLVLVSNRPLYTLGVKLTPVSNWFWCQIGAGVKLSLLHSWCQIGPGVKLTLLHSWCQIDSFTLLVSNWYRCQIDSFTLLVSNCPPHTPGVKLTLVSNWCWCQIVLKPIQGDMIWPTLTHWNCLNS